MRKRAFGSRSLLPLSRRTASKRVNWKTLQTDESLPPLLKGVGLSIVVLATLIGIIHAKQTPHVPKTMALGKAVPQTITTAPVQDHVLAELTQEVAALRA